LSWQLASYQKPAQYVANSLRIIKFLHEHIHDDRVLNGIVINFGEVFEPSLFGCQPIYWTDQDPGIVPDPLIKTEEDYERLPYPDFYTSGLMPQILAVHETAEKLAIIRKVNSR
jgi:hypothetical protein